MNFCGILAGGTGIRMGSNIPKQFINLSGKPIIIHTIQKILSMNCFDYVIIAIHQDYKDYLSNLLEHFSINLNSIILTSGGEERIDSIENVVKCAQKIDNSEDNILVLHDAVRPFISEKIIKESLTNAAQYGACVAGVQAIDTMYEINNKAFVSGFPARKYLIHGQSPDSFKLNILAKALSELTNEERKSITGTVQICALKGLQIKVIEGDYNNIKITTAKDLELAEMIAKKVDKNESVCVRK